LNVRERADTLGTFRFIEVRLMETIAYWTPITPQMELKVMFGRHIYDHAQHADWLGKRTFELRQPEHYTRQAAGQYVELLERMRTSPDVTERLALMYDVVLPGLIARYERYLTATDQLLDAPSVLVVERIIPELKREIADSIRVRGELKIDRADARDMKAREAEIDSVVAA
jgi:hypothetical protein